MVTNLVFYTISKLVIKISGRYHISHFLWLAELFYHFFSIFCLFLCLVFLLPNWNYGTEINTAVVNSIKLQKAEQVFSQSKTILPLSINIQFLPFKNILLNFRPEDKGLTEQYLYSVSGTFIMLAIITVPCSNRNFIMHSNWWVESFSSYNKLSSAGFISRTSVVSSGQSFIFNFWIYEMQIAWSLIPAASHGKWFQLHSHILLTLR